MNERIRELADQAGVSITAADKNGVFTLLPDKQKKFAELIVQECANAIQTEKDTGLYNAQQMAGMTVSKTVIKDHFGVD